LAEPWPTPLWWPLPAFRRGDAAGYAQNGYSPKAKSTQLFGTEEIRQLTVQQLEYFADQILVGGMQEA